MAYQQSRSTENTVPSTKFIPKSSTLFPSCIFSTKLYPLGVTGLSAFCPREVNIPARVLWRTCDVGKLETIGAQWDGVTLFPASWSCPAFNLSAVNFVSSPLAGLHVTLRDGSAPPPSQHTSPFVLYTMERKVCGNTRRLFWYNTNYKHILQYRYASLTDGDTFWGMRR